jgi:hypothetical protein
MNAILNAVAHAQVMLARESGGLTTEADRVDQLLKKIDFAGIKQHDPNADL